MSSAGTLDTGNHLQHVLITGGTGFWMQFTADDGIREMLYAILTGLISIYMTNVTGMHISWFNEAGSMKQFSMQSIRS